MIESAVTAIVGFAEAVVTKLFVNTAADQVKGGFSARRRTNAINRIVAKFTDSMEPFFSAEMGEGDARFLAEALQARFTVTEITPAFLATHHFDLDMLAREVKTRDNAMLDSIPENFSSLLDEMTLQALAIAIAASQVIPEWEQVAWRDNFRALETLEEKLDQNTQSLRDLVSTPQNKALTFEQEYKRFAAAEFQRVYVKGVGSIGDAKCLSLDSLYTHLSVKRPSTDKQDLISRAATHTDAVDLIKAVSMSKLLVILGAPGAGKSTIAQFLALRAAQDDWLDATGKPESIVPFLLRVRSFDFGELPNPQSMLQICAPLLAGPTSSDYVLELFKSGRGMLLVDGLDECQIPSDTPAVIIQPDDITFCRDPRFQALSVAYGALTFVRDPENSNQAFIFAGEKKLGEPLDISRNTNDSLGCLLVKKFPLSTSQLRESSERDKVVDWIKNWVTAFPDSRLLVTSRPVGYKKGSLSQAGFSEYEIMPLSLLQQEDFINRWCYAVEMSVSPENLIYAKTTAESASSDLKRRIANAKSVRALAYNPLMLFVICILHRYRGQRLPERKIDLLNDCMNVLLYDFRSAIGVPESVIGDLDAKELRALLEPLAWQMTLDGNEQISDASIRDIFAARLPEINQPSTRANEIMAVIRDRTGVLIEVGPRIYSFMHLFFQEYLAAEECVRRSSYDILLSNVANLRWREIIPMVVAVCKGNQETLIRALLQKGSIVAVVSAMAMLERVPIDLRLEVTAELAKYTSELKKDLDPNKLAEIVEIGTSEAAQVVIELILGFHVISSEDYRNYAAKWDFAGLGRTSVVELASNTLERAIYWNEFDLGQDFGTTRAMGYSNVRAMKRGASWSSLCLGISIKETDNTALRSLNNDPIYRYAVILDTCDLHRGSLGAVCWQAFAKVMSQVSCTNEQKLLALHFTWYFAEADENIDNLLGFLTNFPPDICPAFQIGIMNNAISRVTQECAERVRERAEKLWMRAFDCLEIDLCNLVQAWAKDLYINSDNCSKISTVEELKKTFLSHLRYGLQAYKLFPRE